MTILERVAPEPDWLGALAVALTRPPGVPERRADDDPWRPNPTGRPRRISDDLAWFRDAMDEPDAYGLRPVPDSPGLGAWVPDDPSLAGRLARLDDRGVLSAAGFVLHDDSLVDVTE